MGMKKGVSSTCEQSFVSLASFNVSLLLLVKISLSS